MSHRGDSHFGHTDGGSTAPASSRARGTAGAWAAALGYFLYRRDEFLDHYHKRSNVETAFTMMKRKFGDFVRSKTDVAMVNRALCKVLAHKPRGAGP